VERQVALGVDPLGRYMAAESRRIEAGNR